MYLATFALLKESTADEPGYWQACVREGAALAFATLSKQKVPANAEASPVSNKGNTAGCPKALVMNAAVAAAAAAAAAEAEI